MVVLVLAAGVVLLVAGAETLVRGAAAIAHRFHISPLVVGLTVVAYGTSAPEMAVSVAAALGGRADLALGNVVGSNIFNVLFILGISAVITPLVVSRQLVRIDVPLMIGLSFTTMVLALDGSVGRIDGLLLVMGAIVYTVALIRQSERTPDSGEAAPMSAPRAGALVALGLVLLVGGSRLLVSSAVQIAAELGVSDLVVGLTIIAAGTSLPEVATSVVAAIRGQRDIAVGNVVGSNIFNLLSVLGLTAVLSPDGVAVPAAALRFDLPVMTAVAVACLPIFFTGHRIARWEGVLFLGYWVAYTAYLVLSGVRSPQAPLLANAMLWFAAPLTIVTLVVSMARARRNSTMEG